MLLRALAVLLVWALGGSRLVEVRAFPVHVQSHDARPWLIIAAAAAILTWLGWLLAEARLAKLAGEGLRSQETAREAQETACEAQEAQRQAEARRQEVEARLERTEAEREQERAEHWAYREAWEAQREWNRQLREQVAELQRTYGFLGHVDVHELLLKLTMELTECQKGMLLTGASDGEELALVAALGFEHDPTDSALAQRFGSQVLERDQMIREDDQRAVDAAARSQAEEEIENLLAIPIYLFDGFNGVIVCANRSGGFDDLDDEVLAAVGKSRRHRAAERAAAWRAARRVPGRRADARTPACAPTPTRWPGTWSRWPPPWVSSRGAGRSCCSARCGTMSARSASLSGSCSSRRR